jgi:hypothetical protein
MRAKPFEAFSGSWINRYHDYMPLWARDGGDTSPTASARRRKGCTIVALSILIIVLIPFILLSLGGMTEDGTRGSTSGVMSGDLRGSNGGGGKWQKPAGLTVVAFVFYGRRANVQILERYLRVSPSSVVSSGVVGGVDFVCVAEFGG